MLSSAPELLTLPEAHVQRGGLAPHLYGMVLAPKSPPVSSAHVETEAQGGDGTATVSVHPTWD